MRHFLEKEQVKKSAFNNSWLFKLSKMLYLNDMNRSLKKLLLFNILLFPFFASAQQNFLVKRIDFPPPFSRIALDNFTTDDKGFIYLITNQGMWRYDGTNVQPMNIGHSELPQSSTPLSMKCYRNLMFFDMSNKGRLFCFDSNTGVLYDYPLHARVVHWDKSDVEGLTFYTRDGQVFKFSKYLKLEKSENISALSGWTPSQELSTCLTDVDHQFYLISGGKLGLVHQKKILWENPSAPAPEGDIRTPLHSLVKVTVTDKYIAVDYSNGLVIYDKRQMKRIYEYHGIDFAFTLNLKNNITVFTRENNQHFHIKGTRFFTVQRLELPYMQVRDVVAGQQNDNYILRTEDGLFNCNPGKDLADNSVYSGLAVEFFKNKSIRSIYRSGEKLYVGAYQGLFVCSKTGITKLSSMVVYTMSPADPQTLILGIEGGVGFVTLNMATDQLTDVPKTGPDIHVTKIVNSGDAFICGTKNMLLKLFKDTQGNWTHKPLLMNNELGLVKDIRFVNNTCYLGAEGGFFKVQGGRLKKIFPVKEKLIIYSIIPDGDGFWLGTFGRGLLKITKNGDIVKQIRFNEGLAGDYVYSLFRSGNLLFAGTNGGVSIFDMSDGMAPVHNSANESITDQYNQEFNHSAIFFDTAQNKLILGGLQGLSILNLKNYSQLNGPLRDPVILSYIKKGTNGGREPQTDLFAFAKQRLLIKSDENYLGVKFAHNNWQKEILWRFPELGDKWQKGQIDQDINIYAMPPGTYTLEARYPSVTNSRFWFSKTLIVEPKFYQTWFFKALLLLAASGFAYMIWRLKIQQIITEHRLRTTIASDLHDEIGGALTRISMSSEILLMDKKHNERVLERISNDSKKAISSISDIIWSIDSRNDTWGDMILRMREHAFVLLEDSAQLNFSASGADDQNTISQELRQNLYLVFKEAVNNTVRHNQSPDVLIDIVNNRTVFKMLIKNTTNKIDKIFYSGQGLNNIAMRSKRIKASLDVQESGGHFTISLILPK